MTSLFNREPASVVHGIPVCFGCEVLEVVETGHAANGSCLHWVLPVPKWRGGVSAVVAAICRIHPRLARAMLPRFYRPVELNIVVRKPRSRS